MLRIIDTKRVETIQELTDSGKIMLLKDEGQVGVFHDGQNQDGTQAYFAATIEKKEDLFDMLLKHQLSNDGSVMLSHIVS